MKTLPLPEAMMRQASAWVGRHAFDEDLADPEFTAWIAADPRHRQAYDQVAGLIADPAMTLALTRLDRQPARRGTTLRWLAACACLMLLAAGLARPYWQSGQASPTILTSAVNQGGGVTLDDGSSVALDGDSRLEVTLTAAERRVVLTKGEAFFDIAHDEARPFLVSVGAARIRVLGTAFDVNLTQDGVELLVYRGRVSFTVAGVESFLTAGQRMVLQDGHLGPIKNFDSSSQDWRSGWLDTDGISLAHLVERLNRHSSHPIGLTDPRLAAIEVAGRFRLDDPAALLGGLGSMYGFKLEKRDGRILLKS